MNARAMFSLITLSVLGARLTAHAQNGEASGGQPFIQGPAIVGNGVTNGVGTSLGRLFVTVRGLEGEAGGDDRGVSLEIALTSAGLRVEPTTCAASSKSGCASPGRGLAAVNGYPTVFATNFMHLKLGGAIYLPYDLPGLAGSSFEVAFEGVINVGTAAPENATCTLLLAESDPDRLLSWGGESTADRPFGDNTGNAIIVSDTLVYTFPGRLKGVVLKNDGKSVLVALRTAEFRDAITVPGRELTLQPDFEAAADAGLPEGTFFLLETNYTGAPSPSSVFPGAATNDVEIVVTAKRLARDFARGDCNGDGDAIHGLLDAVFLLDYNFLGGREPPCLLACDADGDGAVAGSVTDALYLLAFAFLSGPPPPPPFPGCGPAPPGQSAGLSCEIPVCGGS